MEKNSNRMKGMWDARYGGSDYAYGKEPNEFFRESMKAYSLHGDILFPAEGEGRNAVFASKRGCNVFAFDISKQGKDKAVKLALESDVKITFKVGDLFETKLHEQSYDAIVLIYAHFPPQILKTYHNEFVKMLNPGGYLILEGFSESNIEYREKNKSIGGPDNIEMLFSKEKITDSFKGLEVLSIEEKVVELNEGQFHKGEGAVIRYIGRKV